jgi:hypothetical protein
VRLYDGTTSFEGNEYQCVRRYCDDEDRERVDKLTLCNFNIYHIMFRIKVLTNITETIKVHS